MAYSDPHVPVFPELREHSFDLESVELTAELLSSFDVVLLATNHDEFDYNLIRENSQIVIDTRGHYRKDFKSLVKA